MKHLSKVLLLIVGSIILQKQSIAPALHPDTEIVTVAGSQKLANLTREDSVTGFDAQASTSTHSKIENIAPIDIEIIVEITLENDVIYASKNQLFYDEQVKDFIPAQDLTTKSKLIDRCGSTHACLCIKTSNISATFYELTLEEPHVFFCGKAQVLAHNIAWAATPWLIPALESLAGFCVTTACLYVNRPSGKIENLTPIAMKTRQEQSKVINPRYFAPQKKNTPHPESVSRKASWQATPPKIHGVRPNPKIYHDILTHPYKYGPYQAVATMTKEGRVLCILFALKFNVRKPLPDGRTDNLGFSWQIIGTETYTKSDPFVRSFAQAEDQKQVKVLRDFYQRVKFPIRSKIQQSKGDIASSERYIYQAHGNLDQTIYGWTFGIFAVYSMGEKGIAPSAVIEALYCGVTLRDDHPARITCNYSPGNLSVLVNRSTKKIINIERYSDYKKKKKEKEKKKKESENEEGKGKRKKTIEDVIKESEDGEKTSGPTTQYEQPKASPEKVFDDFDEIESKIVKDSPGLKAGDTPDGTRIVARGETEKKRATLEVQYPGSPERIKIRYGPKK